MDPELSGPTGPSLDRPDRCTRCWRVIMERTLRRVRSNAEGLEAVVLRSLGKQKSALLMGHSAELIFRQLVLCPFRASIADRDLQEFPKGFGLCAIALVLCHPVSDLADLFLGGSG